MTRLDNRLVLWDIDHTVLSVGSMSRELYEHAFALVTGGRLGALADMAGRTERAILTETLTRNGITPTPETVTAFYEALGRAAGRLQRRMAEVGRVLPGVPTVIDALAHAGVTQSVVTGNLRPVARAKLTALGMAARFDLESGGYGDDGSDRSDLVRLAIERAGLRHGRAFTPATTLVIGDTPHDVRGAHAVGARAVAVATGRSGCRELYAAGADAALTDLGGATALRTLTALLR